MLDANKKSFPKKPEWLKIKLPYGFKTKDVVGLLKEKHLNTICASGLCPNRAECWGAGTATFMICGNICTRNCKFCNVTNNKPLPLDKSEITKIADSVKSLNLKHVVITSVDRDDLPDQAVSHWVNVLNEIKKINPHVTIEALIPDFQGNKELLDKIIKVNIDVVAHNVETVRRLTPEVRSVATYDRSLEVLRYLALRNVRTKTGIMLGLGETEKEILETIKDIHDSGCQIITIGQYLQPSRKHYELKKYVSPEQFEKYGQIARDMGFRHVESGPFVRSSYHSEKHVR